MSALAFFPWLPIEAEFSVESYRFTPFARGRTPGGQIQVSLDAVLEPYLEGEGRPVRSATILAREGTELSADLDDDAVADLFDVAELVAFAGLSAREFFLPGGTKYSNRETYALIIQQFTDPMGGVAVRTRRRDGSTHGYVARSQFRVRRPLSQSGTFAPQLDRSLLVALLRARNHADYPTLAEAIFFFNQANTDSDLVPEQAEVVFMVSAFERLLDCRGGNEHDLAQRFLATWRTEETLIPATRIPHSDRGRPITETWIRDFFKHRGFHAHGRREARHAAIWSPGEHLLLGAYAFPLLVKQWIAKRGLFVVTDSEQGDIDVFDHLASADLFPPQDPDGIPSFPWNTIRGQFKFRRVLSRAWDRTLFGTQGA